MSQDTEKTGTNESSQNFALQKEDKEASSIKEIIVTGTPFGIVVTDRESEENCFVALGNKRLTPLITREQANEAIKGKDWDLIVQLCMHIMEHKETIDKINQATRTTGMPE